MPGKPIRAKGQTATTISLSAELLERVDKLAAKEGRARSAWIVRQLERLMGGMIVDIPSDLLDRIDAMASAAGLSRETWILMAMEKGISAAPTDSPIAASGRKQSTTPPESLYTPRSTVAPHLECPPEMMPRGPKIPARTAFSTNRPGSTTSGLNEAPAEERQADVKPADRLKGQPKPRSTRGIRGVSRPGGQGGEK